MNKPQDRGAALTTEGRSRPTGAPAQSRPGLGHASGAPSLSEQWQQMQGLGTHEWCPVTCAEARSSESTSKGPERAWAAAAGTWASEAQGVAGRTMSRAQFENKIVDTSLFISLSMT